MADNGSLHVEEADGVGLELLLRWLVAFQVREAGDAVPLEAPVQRRARQVRDRGLQRIEAVVEREQAMAAEGDDHRLLLEGQHRGMRLGRTHRPVGHRLAPAPLLDRGRADPVAAGQRSYAFFTPL